jgi:hypothetical protein
MKKLILAALALTVTLSGAAFADPVSHRQEVQQGRIAHGIRDGQITPGEAVRLERGERRIQRLKRRALRRLQRRMNRQSRAIFRAAHNRRRAR